MGKKAQILDTKHKAQRIAARQALGKLQDLIVSERTTTRYRKALTRWFLFLQSNQIAFPNTSASVDKAISHYISCLWEEGEGRALAANTLAALQHYIPGLRYNLPTGWRLYKAWGKSELPARAPPLTLDLLKAMCGVCFNWGWPELASSLLIGFFGFLRTGELLFLRKNDIAIADDFSSIVLNLGSTKSGSRIGVNESVTFQEPFVAQVAAAQMLTLMPGDAIISYSQATFRDRFNQVLEHLNLVDFGFKPYSLRRGGATFIFRESNALSPVVVRGRWSNARTARIYINEGLATLAQYQFAIDRPPISEAITSFNQRTKRIGFLR
jgi:hypothetical protein